MQNQPFVEEVRAVLQARLMQAQQSGRTALAVKWQRELDALATEAAGCALIEAGVQARVFATLAIYATQKVRRLVGARIGTGRADPCTRAVLINAQATGRITNIDALASLTKALDGKGLATQRASAETTATTQASSTRAALLAVNAARKDGKTLVIDFTHPLVRAAIS